MKAATRLRRLRWLADRCGEAAIEFAFVFPLLLLIAFGLIDFGRALQLQTTLNYAVQAAARCYAVDFGTANPPTDGHCNLPGQYGVRSASQTASYAQSIANGLTAPTSLFCVNGTAQSGTGTCPAVPSSCNTGTSVYVYASLQFNLFPGVAPIGERRSGIPTSVRLGSSSCFAWSGITF